MADPPINPLSIGFPQINQKWADERGVVNQLWLQLLIALWNRTGNAPGGSIIDVINYFVGLDGEAASAAETAASLDAAIMALTQAQQSQIDEAIARHFLLNPPPVDSDPLLALVLGNDSAGGAADECACCTPVEPLAAGGVITLASYACGTIFTNEAA